MKLSDFPEPRQQELSAVMVKFEHLTEEEVRLAHALQVLRIRQLESHPRLDWLPPQAIQ